MTHSSTFITNAPSSVDAVHVHVPTLRHALLLLVLPLADFTPAAGFKRDLVGKPD